MKLSQLSYIHEHLNKPLNLFPDAKITESRDAIILTIRIPKDGKTPDDEKPPVKRGRPKKEQTVQGVDLSTFEVRTPEKSGEEIIVSCSGKTISGLSLMMATIRLLQILGVTPEVGYIEHDYPDSQGKRDILAILKRKEA